MATTIHWNNALLLAKIEANYGVDPAPVVATDVMLAYDISFNPVREAELRPDSAATFGKLGVVVGRRYCNFSFKIISYGGKVGADLDPVETPLLQMAGTAYTAAGVAAGAIFKPKTGVAGTTDSDTLWFYRDGIIRKLTGCRTNCIIRWVAGKHVELEFNGIGIYAQSSALAMGVPTRPVVTTPMQALSSAFTIASAVVKTETFEFDLGNELTLSECVNAATGIAEVNIVNRDPRLTANPEADTTQAVAWEGYMDSQTAMAISAAFVGAALYGLQLSIPVGKMFSLEEGERNGKLIYNMNIIPTENSAIDDDYVLTYEPV